MKQPLDVRLPGEWLAAGQSHLAAGELRAAADCLGRARQCGETRLAAHNLIERHGLEGCFTAWMGCPCEIAPADDIFRFFAEHPLSINPLRDYLADGWRTLSELMLLLEAVDQPLLKTPRFLEFASGHGRFTRHLVKALGAGRVTASDVVADAVEFARDALGVTALPSTREPEALHWPARYDVVFVLSLFSHLPRRTWGRWLKKLFEAVAPGGLLVFSTHGAEAARRQGVQWDAEGFYFAAASESQAIDVADYGTAFTSPAFVQARIAEEIGGAGQLAHFAPQHFWHHQDAYLVRRPA